jgi:hypothetical protein
VEVEGGNAIRCNFWNPLVWREALEVASAFVEGEGPILIFTCGLNLLLVSPNYGGEYFFMLLDTIREPASRRIPISKVSRV